MHTQVVITLLQMDTPASLALVDILDEMCTARIDCAADAWLSYAARYLGWTRGH